MPSKINPREKAYFWLGYMRAFRAVANMLWGKPRHHICWEGLNEARTELRNWEVKLYEELLSYYPADRLAFMVKNNYLEEDKDGTGSRERNEEKAPKGQSGFVLYKLGKGLWAFNEEERK
jgi:hypothetical protein